MSIQFKTEDVVKLILQFLKENNLTNSFKTLQEETQTSLNIVPKIDIFINYIKQGKWDFVLLEVQLLKLPGNKLLELYEIIIAELLELGESECAQILVQKAIKQTKLYLEYKERVLRLDYLSRKTPIDIKEIYQDGLTKEKRRQKVADSLQLEIAQAPPSRLLYYLGFFFKKKQQQLQIKIQVIDKVDKIVKFGQESRIQCAEFNKKGDILALGSADGIIELWDSILMKQRLDFQYQKEEQYMFHENSVHSLSFSSDSQILASGDQKGIIKLWNLKIGKCYRKIEGMFSNSINILRFSPLDQFDLYLCNNSNSLKLYGIRSGAIKMEYRRQKEGKINDFLLFENDSIITAGSDGFLVQWEKESGYQKKQYIPPRSINQTANEVEIWNIFLLDCKNIVLCDKSERIIIINGNTFESIRVFKCEEKDEFVSGCISQKQQFIYGITNKGYLYTFDSLSGKMEGFMQVNENFIIGIKHHPSTNVIILLTLNGDFIFMNNSK
ncbi:WD40 repeat family protein [Ichthyophthirius multifiliis]|uniref:WD40 repeat family protein n=1 Tax=Ichthyophthirius multifiliis TaxID=5932 RepID=G0QV46_ICHMU|nr:WD40 repeat family protein [Ichthyophthirius multifiliis]EGR30920.1 WD40 repeat family protein [Ichthyophthirius multifiliis]|eukprot:XP_004032507.1 WD40 repeat family protein [Ichthyophthirius multifiliis]